MLTKTGMNNILKRIMTSGELSEEMEKDVQAIQAHFDEAEGFLKNHGSVYDAEDKDEYEYVENPPSTEPNEYETKYNTMKQKYIDRFFGAVPEDETKEDIMKETEEDVKRDGEEQTIDELFQKVEG